MGKQLRFDLLKRLAEDEQRHLLLLTATPHSGDEDAFDRLLGLVNPDFSRDSLETDAGRRRLARHFVQRRRIDITGREWGEERTFPKHLTAEKTYDFTPVHRAFHDAVLDYCLGVVEGAGSDNHSRRLAFWSTLALMRCVGSSPSAALSALRTRLNNIEELEDQLCDEDEAEGLDVEPASVVTEDAPLLALIELAERLTKAPDPKLDKIITLLRPLVAEGSKPIVFCRFIATADHVAAGLRKAFPKVRVEAVTGLLTPEDRRTRVESMSDSEPRILVATDCLSEGINLQHLFDSVVHYDLSWNPTRHQQREGRVDRFGQAAEVVRSVLLFSPDSSIDGAVLEVILRKAEAIRLATGVTVPLPEEHSAVAGALMNAVLLRRGRTQQLALDFGVELSSDSAQMEARWRDAEEGERRSRARFAQNTIRPEEVAPVWHRWQSLLGGPAEVQRFLERAMSRLNAPLESGSGNTMLAHLDALPLSLREHLAARNLEGTRRFVFREPGPGNADVIVRNHPMTALVADYLLEGALHQGDTAMPSLGRIGVWPTEAVQAITTLVLLRLRFKLIVHGRREKLLLVEEASALAFAGNQLGSYTSGDDAFKLLESPASGNLAPAARDHTPRQLSLESDPLQSGRLPEEGVCLITATRLKGENFVEIRDQSGKRCSANRSVQDHDAHTGRADGETIPPQRLRGCRQFIEYRDVVRCVGN